MQRLVGPLLQPVVELVLVILQALEQPLAVGLVDDGVVKLHPGLLDVGDQVVVALPRAGDPVDLVALGEYRDVGELGSHHVGRRGVHGLLVVVAVPRQDDPGDPVEPVLLPQHVDVLRERLAVALTDVVDPLATVDPLERDPRRGIRVQARGADVEHHVHLVRHVEVEVEHPLLCDQLEVRLAVDGGRVDLFEGDVVLLLEHPVVAEPLEVGVTGEVELLLGADRRQAGAAHHLVQVVDRADDDLGLGVVLEGLHQCPQRVLPLATRGAHRHQPLRLVLVVEDRHDARDRVLAGE